MRLKLSFIIIGTLLFLGFKTPTVLKVASKTTLNVSEPSALSFSLDKKNFYTVSDSDGTIYKLDLNGKTVQTIRTNNDDLEGIVVHSDLGSFCIVQERMRSIVCYNELGKVSKSKSINFPGSSNAGFEGITYNARTKRFYIVNEKSPAAILELDSDFNLLKTIQVSNALDLSDITYDEKLDQFFVLSHESKKILIMDHAFRIVGELKIPEAIQAEGIAIDSENKKIYIVSDKDSAFITYQY